VVGTGLLARDGQSFDILSAKKRKKEKTCQRVTCMGHRKVKVKIFDSVVCSRLARGSSGCQKMKKLS